MTRLSGVIPPVITPLTADGAVDTASLESVLAHHLSAGVTGLFALGSSGEGVYLRDADRRLVVDVVVSVVARQVPVFAGAVDATTNRVLDQARWLIDAGVDVLVVTAPFYANVTGAETRRHFELVAAASPLPVFAYDIPGNVGRLLDEDSILPLLADGTLAGLKDSSGDLPRFARIIERLGQARTATMLTGADTGALAALEAGADGIVPGIGNVRPDLFVRLLSAFEQGDRADCDRLQKEITALTEVFRIGERHGVGRHASELGGLKSALSHAGVITDPTVSPPMSPYPEPARQELHRLMDALA